MRHECNLVMTNYEAKKTESAKAETKQTFMGGADDFQLKRRDDVI